MKTKKIIVLALLVILIIASIWEQVYVIHSINNIQILANEIKNEIESNNELNSDLYNKIEKLNNQWYKTEYSFCFLISHNDMKEIGDNICQAKTILKNNNRELLLEKINLIIYYSGQYKETMSFNIQNIF